MFDKIIMNPPYHKTLHLQILNEARQHSNNVINLSPIRWIQDPFTLYKSSSPLRRFMKLAENIKNIDVLKAVDSQEHFSSGQVVDLGIYEVHSDESFDTWKEINKSTDKTKVSKEIIVPLLKDEKDCIENHLENKMREFHVICPWIHGHPGRKDMVYIISKDKDVVRGPSFTFSQCVVNFDSDEEAESFRKTLLSKLYMYITKQYKLGLNLYYKFYPWLGEEVNPRTGLKGYEGEWTDDDLYVLFGITPDEQKVIEETMKAYE